MNFVHIGLGKTGSTSLQNSFFNELPRLGFYIPGAQELSLFRDATIKSEVGKCRELIKGFPEPFFLSHESLAGWDSHCWEVNSEFLKEVFEGISVVILISVREFESWAQSLYLQKVYRGYCGSPERFFVEKNDYQPATHRYGLNTIDLNNFSYERLASIYSSAFERFLIIDFDSMFSRRYWFKVLEVDPEEFDKDIQDNISSHFNRSLNPNYIFLYLSINRIFSNFRDSKILCQTRFLIFDCFKKLFALPCFRGGDALLKEINRLPGFVECKKINNRWLSISVKNIGL